MWQRLNSFNSPVSRNPFYSVKHIQNHWRTYPSRNNTKIVSRKALIVSHNIFRKSNTLIQYLYIDTIFIHWYNIYAGLTNFNLSKDFPREFYILTKKNEIAVSFQNFKDNNKKLPKYSSEINLILVLIKLWNFLKLLKTCK